MNHLHVSMLISAKATPLHELLLFREGFGSGNRAVNLKARGLIHGLTIHMAKSPWARH